MYISDFHVCISVASLIAGDIQRKPVHGCAHFIKHLFNVCLTEGPLGSRVWWWWGAAEEQAGGRGLFSHQHGWHNESDKAEGPNCTLLVFSDVGLFLFHSLSPFEDLVTFERNSPFPFFFLIPFSLGLFLFIFFGVLKIELCLAQ